MNAKRILLLYLTLISLAVKAQDLHFSQLSRTPLLLNPAHTSASEADHRASAHFRSQWASVAKSYMTYGASYDVKLRKKFWKNKQLGLGVVLLNDQAGDALYRRLKGDLMVAYHQRIGYRNWLGAGIRLGALQHSLDLSNAEWDNQYDGDGFNPGYASGENREVAPFWAFDAGAGVLWTYVASESYVTGDEVNMFQIGLSVAHFSLPRESFYTTAERYSLRYLGEAIVSIAVPQSNLAVRPSVLYQRMGKEQEFVIGCMLRHRLREGSHQSGLLYRVEFSYGAYYRFLADALAPSFYVGLGDWGLGVSYDFNFSKLRTASAYQGGVEVCLKYGFADPYRAQRFSYPGL